MGHKNNDLVLCSLPSSLVLSGGSLQQTLNAEFSTHRAVYSLDWFCARLLTEF